MANPWLLGLIPARGGSKGLPRKNARRLHDRYLLDWTAEAWRRAAIEESVLALSTDDEEIARIGRDLGIDAPFVRPDAIAGDEASAESVALHALDWFERERNLRFEAVMWLQPTSPFRDPAIIRTAVEVFMRGSIDGVLAVKPIYRTPATLFHLSTDGMLSPLGKREELKSRRQEVAPLFTPNGALYLVSSRVLRNELTFFPSRAHGLPMDAIASLDIDTPTDWQIAEALAQARCTWLTQKSSN